MWVQIGIWLVTSLLSYMLQPKPQNAKPAGLSDIQAPTATVGLEISVLFGTRLITGPNVVWYGDLRTTPIKSGGGKK